MLCSKFHGPLTTWSLALKSENTFHSSTMAPYVLKATTTTRWRRGPSGHHSRRCVSNLLVYNSKMISSCQLAHTSAAYPSPSDHVPIHLPILPYGRCGGQGHQVNEIVHLLRLPRHLLLFCATSWNRFTGHPTFLYLVYDVLQRRQAALRNSIVVKRKDWDTA